MNGYYKDKIKVVCITGQVFPVNPKTLEATSTGTYEPPGTDHSEPEALEVISWGEWSKRRNKMWDRELESVVDEFRYQ